VLLTIGTWVEFGSGGGAPQAAVVGLADGVGKTLVGVGFGVGATVGVAVGATVGVTVGLAVAVGWTVGRIVGKIVGTGDGVVPPAGMETLPPPQLASAIAPTARTSTKTRLLRTFTIKITHRKKQGSSLLECVARKSRPCAGAAGTRESRRR
jgi:hypothetical protein